MPETSSPLARWSDALDAQAWRRILFVLVCIAPLVSGVVSRIARDSHWFGDYEAIVCAGERQAAGLSIYEREPTCEGLQPTGYVYLPWVARAFHAASEAIGDDALRVLYLAVHFGAFALLGWIAFLSKRPAGGLWDRLLVLGLVTGSTIYWGNIAPPIHAFIAAAALVAPRRPTLFAIALAAAATVKPVFLTYGLVLLAIPIPIWKRLALGGVAAGLGLLPTLQFVTSGGPLVEAWNANVDHYVYAVQPGDGLFGWLGLLGGDPGTIWAQGLWLVFAALITLAVLRICVRSSLTPDQRVWLAMGAGVLANPRIVPLDVMLLACLVGALVHVARTSMLSDRERRWTVGVAVGAVFVGALGNSLDAGDYAPKLATLGLFAVLASLALRLPARPTPSPT